MKRIAVAVAVASLSVPLVAFAQAWNLPPENQRCPSKWGAGDERGSGNHMKNPQNVLRAARLIKTGEVIELSHVLAQRQAAGAPDAPSARRRKAGRARRTRRTRRGGRRLPGQRRRFPDGYGDSGAGW